MSPNDVVELAVALGAAAVVALQTWVLKEVYSIRVALTRMEERHDSSKAEITAVALRVTALEARS